MYLSVRVVVVVIAIKLRIVSFFVGVMIKMMRTKDCLLVCLLMSFFEVNFNSNLSIAIVLID